MQKGQIFQRHGAWHLRYRTNGKQVCVKLTDYSDDYRTLKSVRPLAERHLQPVNQGFGSDPQTVQQFIDLVYLPHVELHRRPSTVKGYRNLYNRYIRSHVAGVRLFGFRTRDGQSLLNRVAAEHQLSHLTLIHVKSFLSGVFTLARRVGSLDTGNPMQGVEVPKGNESDQTYAYSNGEFDTMLSVLEGVPRVAVTVAAYTGLSLGELRGLQWQDISDEQLNVQRTIWHGIEGKPKTKARKDSIPLLPIVRDGLKQHRKSNPGTTWIFEGPYARPLDLATLGSKRIKSALQGSGVDWHGWHALRRGFATRLHEAGVQDRIIQALMRHSSLSVTMTANKSTRKVPMKPKTFKNAEEFTRYVEGLTGKPFKAAASTDGTTAHKYLSGQRDYMNLFTDSDLIAILHDKHPDDGLLYVFSDYSSVVYKPSTTN